MNSTHKFFNQERRLIAKNDSLNEFGIPYPTSVLLFITKDDPANLKNPLSISISLTISGLERDGEGDFYSEPSLIWARLPIQKNSELEVAKIYYPMYSSLSPRCRYQYLQWLKNVTQDTNLSYVFLYYYGLERHLLLGNYELALEEIVRLLKFHDKGSFKGYATNALIASSIFRKKTESLKNFPFVLNELSNASLFIRTQIKFDLTVDEIIIIAPKVGFKKGRYIKERKEIFIDALSMEVDKYKKENGLLLDSINWETIEYTKELYFANISIPEKIRSINTPNILQNLNFKQTLLDLLHRAHIAVKEIIKEEMKNN